MQCTLELEDSFVNAIKKEFNTPNLKDALYTLYRSYKEKNIFLEVINPDSSDYRYILDAKKSKTKWRKALLG
ncbi:MAG: hypothetical protein JXQ76_06780 [Campylobacterales bacterium]|nr:hypothetical protein [Campylobacterales bacterium]